MPVRSGLHDEQRDAGQQPPTRAMLTRAGTTLIRSVSAWEEAINRHLGATTSTVVADKPFHGRLRARDLDVVRLLHLDVPPHRLLGSPAAEGPSYQFVLPVHGSVRVTQESRRSVVDPGRFVVLDTTFGYELAFEDAATLIVIRIPREVIGIPPILMQKITGTGIGVDGDLIAIIMPMLVRLADDLIVFSRHSPARLAHNLTDLLTTVLLEHLSAAVPHGSAPGLLLQITSYLDDHLGDSDLTAETVASAVYISPRYLRKLFEGQHVKVSDWIRARRLETCRRQLVDPVFADEPISAVAARWGFSDPAQFSRLFRATYGHSPREYRRDGLDRRRQDDTTDKD
jgi:AraC-like DNA-binding protein